MNILNNLKGLINETLHQNAVKSLVNYLNEYYEPTSETYLLGDDFYKEARFKRVLDEELITPESLLNYLDGKFDYSRNFIMEVIKAWASGTITNKFELNTLTPI